VARVALTGVSKRFGDRAVVERFDLEVESGELMVLLGPSGCGKSTLLRMIAGLERPDAGTIRIGDRVVNDLPPRDRDIAMVFQNYALYPHMTVAENLAFGLEMRRVSRAERDRAVGDTAARLGLEGVLDRTPRQLSGGQQQRVALGRALVRNPAVFLFDEPLSNLDAALRLQTRAEIARLQRELGATTIYVTHDQVEAMTLGQRIAVVEGGVLRQCGAPQELYDRPANRFVGAFLGSPPMNLLTGEVDAFEGLAGNGWSVGFAALEGARPAPGATVTAGIRPEHLTLVPSHDGAAVAITAEVDVVEPLGAEAIVHVTCGRQRLACRVPPVGLPRAGDRVHLAGDLRHVHLFDDGGRRMS
jgi:multiple sugar transport system ATP-binding protein